MKKILCVVLCLAFVFSLAGCYDSNEISKLAFVLAVGIDEAEDKNYAFTFQIVKPSAFTELSSEESPLVSTTINAKTIYEAMDQLNTDISEKCDYSHTKLIVLSQEILKTDTKNQFKALLKSGNFHPNTRVAMAVSSSADYLKNISIPLDANPAEYYENIFKNGYTVYSPDTKLRDFETMYGNFKTCNVLPVVEGSKEKGDEKESSLITSYNKKQMAIIKDNTFYALVQKDDVFWYNLLTNRNFTSNYYIPLANSEKNIVVEINKSSQKINIDMSKKPIVANFNITLDGNIVWSESEDDYVVNDMDFKSELNEKAQWELTQFLYNCSNVYKADILNLSRYAKKNYLTIKSWEKEDWQGLFENMEYNVKIDIKLKREGISID